ncbi:MAG: glycosyltransferase, partial [Nitrosopumilales archaeon]
MIQNELFDYYIVRNSGFFDSRFYLREYQDIRSADIDPLWHFIRYGWKEGRNPSKTFDTKYYLDSNPDVRYHNINPLVHYIRFGKREGRITINRSIKNIDIYSANESLNNIPWNLKLITESRENYLPKVSIIVPNYNHSRFLIERLESIYNQTYKNIEVILLDDYSADTSISLLEGYADKYSENTQCYFNDSNSGSPFTQWKKGISLASGDLIWIAESDDFCDDDFLEKLIPYFADESILLAYAHTIFIDIAGNRHPFAFESYVTQVDPQKWGTSYINTAHNEVNTGLGLLNTIPNVSSVVFRRIDENFPLFNDYEWQKMKVCGDWLFYLNLIRGGRIAYCHETHSYYRIHQAGSSKKAQTQDIYYKEHEKVACTLAHSYNVSELLLKRFHDRLLNYYLQNVKHGDKGKFSACFDFKKILDSRKNRKPNVLIAPFAFSFGGGEIFPIRLANALTENDVSVTVFNGGYEPTQSGVRKMLYPQIPVINNNPTIDINSMLKELGIEIIHTHHASMENLFASRKVNGYTGVKHVATMHGMYEMMENFTLNTREIQKSVDHWIYTADKNIIPFKKTDLYSETKFTRICNGMKLPEFRKLDLSPLGIKPNSFTACLASRALPEKGWKEAIEAIGKVRDVTNIDIHLILIGEGPTYDELQDQTLPG